ncbi:glycosyl transferase [Segatella asaccharophila]|jgi:hypothetical protein
MIPKIIHYCWFGGNPLPESAKKCIASWHKFLPDYEIKEWNESNFNVNIIPYTAEAYKAKKYAFVSDYARFYILYKYGGLYFDTDVEVIRNMDDIIARGPFMGFEKTNNSNTIQLWVNPGLGLGASIGNDFYKSILEYYRDIHFHTSVNLQYQETVVSITTKLLKGKGLIINNQYQEIDGLYIYPSDFFDPMNEITFKLSITDNTRSIHLYSGSWLGKTAKRKMKLKRILGPYFTSLILWLKRKSIRK